VSEQFLVFLLVVVVFVVVGVVAAVGIWSRIRNG
jgi:hypothetical protein